MIARPAVLVIAALGGVAHAETAKPAATPAATSEPPDPAVEDASDANLESTANRRGLTFSGAIGGGLMIGFGIDDSVGRGGSLSLRVGHVATPHTVITFELGITAVLHKPRVTDASTATNTDINLLVGAQHWLNPSLWVRGAGGVGVYRVEQMLLSSGKLVDTLTLVGPAVLGGIGLEVARFKWAVLGVEVGASAMINGDGVLVTSDLGLGLAFD